MSLYIVNINNSYTDTGNSGSVADPLSYSEFFDRTKAGGSGNASDEYQLYGFRDLSSSERFQFLIGSKVSKHGTAPWRIRQNNASPTGGFSFGSSGAIIRDGIIDDRNTTHALGTSSENPIFYNMFFQGQSSAIMALGDASFFGCTCLVRLGITSGVTITAKDSEFKEISQWAASYGTLSAEHCSFEDTYTFLNTNFSVSLASNEFENASIPGASYDVISRTMTGFSPWETAVELSQTSPPGYVRGFWDTIRRGIGAHWWMSFSTEDPEFGGDVMFSHSVYDGFGDIQIAGNGRDLLDDRGLESAVYISLFSNKREEDESALPDGSDKGGFWASSLSPVEIGSRLWLLRRSKNVSNVLSNAEQWAKESLQWMVDSGVAGSVEVIATFTSYKILQLDIVILRPKTDGEDEFAYRYFYNWENQLARRN